MRTSSGSDPSSMRAGIFSGTEDDDTTWVVSGISVPATLEIPVPSEGDQVSISGVVKDGSLVITTVEIEHDEHEE